MDYTWSEIVLFAGLLFLVYVLYELDRRVKALEADNRTLKGQVQWLQGECNVLHASEVARQASGIPLSALGSSSDQQPLNGS
jgi:hypothetical protein